jgi:epidermal growth factor receptor substrate 15
MASFNPTPAEISLTSQIFAVADPQKLGIITGDAAVNSLSGAHLPHAVLGEIWAISDKENNGFLTRRGVSIALRLIGYAQQGVPVEEALLDKREPYETIYLTLALLSFIVTVVAGPLASIEGFSPPPAAVSPPPSIPASQSSPSSSMITFPLTPQDKAKFFKLFIGCGPVNGLLSGAYKF